MIQNFFNLNIKIIEFFDFIYILRICVTIEKFLYFIFVLIFSDIVILILYFLLF